MGRVVREARRRKSSANGRGWSRVVILNSLGDESESGLFDGRQGIGWQDGNQMTGRCHETFKAYPQPNSGPAGLASPLEPIAHPLSAIHWITITGMEPVEPVCRLYRNREPALFLSCSARPERAVKVGHAGVIMLDAIGRRARMFTDGPVPARKINSRADTRHVAGPNEPIFFFFRVESTAATRSLETLNIPCGVGWATWGARQWEASAFGRKSFFFFTLCDSLLFQRKAEKKRSPGATKVAHTLQLRILISPSPGR